MSETYDNFGNALNPDTDIIPSYDNFGVMDTSTPNLSIVYNPVTESTNPAAFSGGQVTQTIQSPNFVHLQSGWQINVNGDAEFQSLTGLTFNGSVINGATINGSTINGSTLETQTTGQRVVISSSTNDIKIYDGSNNLTTDLNSSGLSFFLSGSPLGTISAQSVGGDQVLLITTNNYGVQLDNSSGFFGPEDVIGGTTLGSTVYYWGQIYSSHTTIINPSDRRLKNNIISVNSGIDTIKELNPVFYILKNDKNNDRQIGLIAQDIVESNISQEIKDILVSKGKDDMYMIGYGNIIPLLINAIKELNEKLDKISK